MSTRILVGDVREQLATLPDQSVQCCVTSPPYYGLRDYGTAQWDGGDPSCDHKQGRPGAVRADSTVEDWSPRNRDGVGSMGGDCRKCGAVRIDRQLGLEPTLAEYIATMVDVFRDVRRVLRDDGTLWLNIGDSYAGSGKGGNPEEGKQATNRGSQSVGVLYAIGESARENAVTNVTRSPAGFKNKDLMMVPARLAIAFQDDGWWLRSDIIWAKPNPMPESVTDRPTSSHEHIFLLTKSARYFYDADAVRSPLAESSIFRLSQNVEMQTGSERANGGAKTNGTMKAVHAKPGKQAYITQNGGKDSMALGLPNESGANLRNVWHIATKPYSEAHFATFPPEIPRLCIKAGSAKGDTILDPFAGSGTTGLEADRLERDSILIELNPAYAQLIRDRIHGDCPMFANIA